MASGTSKKISGNGTEAKKSYPRHLLNIDVYICPSDQNKYSFAINNGNGIAAFYEFESDPYLSGCYDSIEEALECSGLFQLLFSCTNIRF